MQESFKNRLADWKSTFLKEHVQPIDSDGKFISSESIVVFAGPPKLEDADNIPELIPIGLVQNMQLSQQKQIQQFFEIGSRRPFFIPGRTQTNCNITRILFDGPSLMKALYAQPIGTAAGVPTMSANVNQAQELPAAPFPEPAGGDLAPVENSGKFFVNLASNFFNKAVGLGFAMYNMDKESYSAVYLEGCYLRAHQFSLAASQTVLAETVNIVVTDVVPLDADLVGNS